MTTAEADAVASHEGALGFDFWLGDWDCAFAGGTATKVDDQGAYLLYVGRRDPERMTLVGRRPDGTPSGMRMVWEDITKDAFVWDYQREDENGWSSQWRIAYRRTA